MCPLLTWVRSTCTDWPDIHWKRRRGSWRRWTSRRVRSRWADWSEAGRYRAWREGRISHAPLSEPAVAYCLYQADQERERWKYNMHKIAFVFCMKQLHWISLHKPISIQSSEFITVCKSSHLLFWDSCTSVWFNVHFTHNIHVSTKYYLYDPP